MAPHCDNELVYDFNQIQNILRSSDIEMKGALSYFLVETIYIYYMKENCWPKKLGKYHKKNIMYFI